MSCLGEYINMVQACKDGIRKAKAQQDLDLVKGNKKGFYKYIGNKRSTMETETMAQWGTGPSDMEKAEIFSIIFFLLQFLLYRFVSKPPRSLSLVVETGRVMLDLLKSWTELRST